MVQILFTYKQAASYLGVSKMTIRRMVTAGKLKVIWLAHRTPRITNEEIERLLKGGDEK
jgi:excisionase family DNA binding protein